MCVCVCLSLSLFLSLSLKIGKEFKQLKSKRGKLMIFT